MGAEVWGPERFEADLVNDVIRPTASEIGRSFIVGSQSMDDSGSANDSRMFFDKAKSAFRAGTVALGEWDNALRGNRSAAFGQDTVASGTGSFASGIDNVASAAGAHVEGGGNTASGRYSHAEGYWSGSSGYYSHCEGYSCLAQGECDHAEGYNTTANSSAITYEGGAHAEGNNTSATGSNGPHAEGYGTTASGDSSHAEGWSTTASGSRSHSEGASTVASGRATHAEGQEAVAYFHASHAHSSGKPGTAAMAQYQRACPALESTAAATWQPLELQVPGIPAAEKYLVIPTGHSWAVDVQVIGRDQAAGGGGTGTGDTAAFFFKAAVKNVAGTASFVGATPPISPNPSYKDAGASGYDCRLVIGNTQANALEVEVLGDASREIVWQATVHITEIQEQ